jgi:hypothetical protein
MQSAAAALSLYPAGLRTTITRACSAAHAAGLNFVPSGRCTTGSRTAKYVVDKRFPILSNRAPLPEGESPFRPYVQGDSSGLGGNLSLVANGWRAAAAADLALRPGGLVDLVARDVNRQSPAVWRAGCTPLSPDVAREVQVTRLAWTYGRVDGVTYTV